MHDVVTDAQFEDVQAEEELKGKTAEFDLNDGRENAESHQDRYKEFTYKWNDSDVEMVTAFFTTEELIILLEGALVAGLGLFLMCAPTSGLITQVIGSLVFLSGIIIVTF